MRNFRVIQNSQFKCFSNEALFNWVVAKVLWSCACRLQACRAGWLAELATLAGQSHWFVGHAGYLLYLAAYFAYFLVIGRIEWTLEFSPFKKSNDLLFITNWTFLMLKFDLNVSCKLNNTWKPNVEHSFQNFSFAYSSFACFYKDSFE